MKDSDDEVAEPRELLRALVALAGSTPPQLQRRLLEHQGATIDVLRLIQGKTGLRVSHVVKICRELGLYPAEFFRMAYPKPEESSRLRRRVKRFFGKPEPVPDLPDLPEGPEDDEEAY